NKHRYIDEYADAATVVGTAPGAAASAREEHHAKEEVAEHRDSAHHHRDHRHRADIVVAHVRHLVADHALQFLAIHLIDQPLRHADDRVCRIAAGRERIGR